MIVRFWLGAQHLDRMGASWPQHLAEFASKGRGVGMYGCGENAKSLALKKHFIMFRLGYLMRIVATWAFFTTHVIVTWVVKWFGHLTGSNPPGGLLPASYPDTLGWVTPGGLHLRVQPLILRILLVPRIPRS